MSGPTDQTLRPPPRRGVKDPRLTWAPMQGGRQGREAKRTLPVVLEEDEGVEEVQEPPFQPQDLEGGGAEVMDEGGESIAKKSVWDRLGGKVGDGDGRGVRVGGEGATQRPAKVRVWHKEDLFTGSCMPNPFLQTFSLAKAHMHIESAVV